MGGKKGIDILSKEVITYDTKSEKCSDLPSMNHARRSFSAVISGDVIVVVGGYGNEGKMKSVECYNASEKIWKDLPDMKKARANSTAVVFPQF